MASVRLSNPMTALGATGGFDVSESGAVVAAVKREALAASVALGYVAG